MKIKIEHNGKLIEKELTCEEAALLGLVEAKEDPFEVKHGDRYYYIDPIGSVYAHTFCGTSMEAAYIAVANACKDKKLMEQRALHETLNRLLWKFAVQNNDGEFDWENKDKTKYIAYYNHNSETWIAAHVLGWQDIGTIHFASKALAERAITEVIKPFIAAHPEFVL